MPIRDTDFLSATMTVRAMERMLFDRERTARLLEARSDEELLRLLAESGYETEALSDFENALSAERSKLFEMLAKSLTGETASLLDVFRAPYDYHNVKILIKSEGSGEPELLLSTGRIPPGELTVHFKETAFSRLPGALGEAARSARETLARTGDPQRADFELDTACLAEMLALAEPSGFVTGYVKLYIDAYNLRSMVRATRIGKGPDFLRLILAQGGNAELWRLAAHLQSGSPLSELYTGSPLAEAAAEGEIAARGEGSLTEFEKLCDNALLAYARGARSVAFGEAPLIGYLLEREAEMTMLRTVVGGRAGGVPAGQIKERLRAVYG